MEEYKFIITTPNGELIFNKRQLKIIPHLMDKFMNQDEIEVEYSYQCIQKIFDYLEYLLTLSKSQRARLSKSETLSGQSSQDRDMFDWLNNWVDDPETIRELGSFMIEYDTSIYVDALAMVYCKDFHLSPDKFAIKHSEIADMDEDEQFIISEYIDWTDGIFDNF